MKRLVLVPLLVALFLFALSGGAWARGKAKPSGAPLNDPTLTPQVNAELQRLTQEKEAALGIGEERGEIGASSLNSYGLQTRPVTNYRQETAYYCGPASTRQSLSFHKTRSGSSASLPSQYTLAGKIGTTSDGSLTTKIASALNSYSGTFGSIWYLASDITGTTSPYETFVNRIGTQLRSITQNPTTPVTLMQTKYIPRYSDHASRHYMTISGIDDRTSPMRMRSVDPNSNSAYYGVFWDSVGTTSASGLCKACYQADLAGTNKAMAW